MKVGLSTSVIQRGKTGIAQYVFALTRALLDLPGGPELTLFVLAEDLPLFAFAEGRARIEIVDESFRPAVRNILWHQTVLPRWVRALGLDVLHVPSYRRLLWPKPCATVATIHDLAPFHVSGKYDWKRMFYGRVIVRRLAARQDEIIAISNNTAADITRFFGLPFDRLHVIHNGLDHTRFSPADIAAGASSPDAVRVHQLDRPYFLYVSRLEHPGKNHVRLIEAFNRFKAATQSPWLLALGGSDWHGVEAIREAAARSPFADDIRFLGFVSDEALPSLYRQAGAMVYPSLYEGFGFPPVEAMACGCPVLTTHRGALAEVVGDSAAIVDPESVEAMALELERLATDARWRARLVEAGLQNAERFSWKTCAEATRQVYRRAADRGAKSFSLKQKTESPAWIS
jgi:glycosyltransferase involved in cell wall biosynthesis